MSYVLMHGGLAATMGSLWHAKTNWWLSVLVLAVVRMGGQMSYLIMSSVTMNENLFALMLTNVYSMLVGGAAGAPARRSPVCDRSCRSRPPAHMMWYALRRLRLCHLPSFWGGRSRGACPAASDACAVWVVGPLFSGVDRKGHCLGCCCASWHRDRHMRVLMNV